MKQAETNAKDARQWIDEWRATQGVSAKPAADNGSKPQAKQSTAENGSKAQASEEAKPAAGKKDEKLPNAKEAQAWIEDWRKSGAGKK